MREAQVTFAQVSAQHLRQFGADWGVPVASNANLLFGFESGGIGAGSGNYWSDGTTYDDWSFAYGSETYRSGLRAGFTDRGDGILERTIGGERKELFSDGSISSPEIYNRWCRCYVDARDVLAQDLANQNAEFRAWAQTAVNVYNTGWDLKKTGIGVDNGYKYISRTFDIPLQIGGAILDHEEGKGYGMQYASYKAKVTIGTYKEGRVWKLSVRATAFVSMVDGKLISRANAVLMIDGVGINIATLQNPTGASLNNADSRYHYLGEAAFTLPASGNIMIYFEAGYGIQQGINRQPVLTMSGPLLQQLWVRINY